MWFWITCEFICLSELLELLHFLYWLPSLCWWYTDGSLPLMTKPQYYHCKTDLVIQNIWTQQDLTDSLLNVPRIITEISKRAFYVAVPKATLPVFDLPMNRALSDLDLKHVSSIRLFLHSLSCRFPLRLISGIDMVFWIGYLLST